MGELPLKIYYGGSQAPSPGVTFTYRENPVLRAFEPLRSFVRCGPSLSPTPTPSSCFPDALWPLGLRGYGRAGLGSRRRPPKIP